MANENLNKKLRTRIAQKWDTVENWEASSLVLLKGELAIDEQNRIKIGDGLHTWNELSFVVDKESTAVIDFPATLPAADAEGLKVGQLAVVDDQLYCLVEKDVDGTKVREWAELSNADEIAGLNASIVALKNDMDAKDAAHDAAIVALQGAVDGDLNDVKDAVAQNASLIAENRADLDGVLDITRDDQTGEVTKRTVKLSAIPEAIYVDGKINSAALPAFVDDVLEGIIAINNVDSDVTYALTHDENGKIIGFFGIGEDSGTTKTLKLITAGTPDSNANLTGVSTEVGGITYNFAPVAEKEAPSTSVIYVDVMSSKSYRWSGTQFVAIAGDLALGTTSSSAFFGDRGLAVEQEVFGDGTDEKVGLVTKVADLETALADEVEARNTAMVSLATDLENFKTSAESKHQELEDEIASSIVALKEESERADQAHDAAIVALQEQVSSISATASGVDFNAVISNSEAATEGAPLNDEILVLDCGGASA